MRIALVQPDFNLRGSLAREGFFLARFLLEHGIDVDCYCDPVTRTILDGVRFHDIRPATRSSSRIGLPVGTASFAIAATRAVRRDRSRYDAVYVTGATSYEHDVVRAHAVMKAEQARWPARGGRTFRAARTRAALAPVLRPIAGVVRTIERFQFRPGHVRRVVAASEEVRDDLIRVHGVDRSVIDVCPLPVDVERFASREESTELRRRLGVDDRTPLLLFVGHDFERKGLAEAIRALRGLEPEARLVVVGDGDRRRFERIAQDEGVEHRVDFVGGTDKPERFFASADAFVLPTREDVWGMALVEAMAAGVPVVATAVAGAADAVRSARAGVVLDEGRPDDIRAAVAELLRNPAEQKAMSERGRAHAQDYAIDRFGGVVLAALAAATQSPPSVERTAA
jgi:UDP-glucose:(heptosyl)LPS alpha-1,3-glucosyltransferase